MIRAGGLLLAAALFPAAAQAQDREWWWNAPFKAFTMPAQSMDPTIPPRAYLIATKREPAEIRRGDVIAFRVRNEIWVKRVIGLSGDRVRMIDGKVRLNGALAEYGPAIPYATGRLGKQAELRSERLPGAVETYQILDQRPTLQDDTDEVTVPAGRLFLLGDNRDNSADSRFSLAEGGLELVALADVYGVVDSRHIARPKAAGMPEAPAATHPK